MGGLYSTEQNKDDKQKNTSGGIKNIGDKLQTLGGLIMVIGTIGGLLGGILLIAQSSQTHSYYSNGAGVDSIKAVLGWIVLIGVPVKSLIIGLLICAFGAITEKYLGENVTEIEESNENKEFKKDFKCEKCGAEIKPGDFTCKNCKEPINWGHFINNKE